MNSNSLLFSSPFCPSRRLSTFLRRRQTFYGSDAGKRLQALRNHDVDAIALNVCYVERELEKGRNVLAGLKTIDEKIPNQSHCRTSTALYPNWTFLISPTIDTSTTVKIAKALYAMDDKQDGEFWTIASDYASADALFKTLKIGPYSYLRTWTLSRVWDEYKLIISIGLLSVLFFIWHYFRVRAQVDMRTKALRLALSTERQLRKRLENVTKKLEKTQKVVMVSQLSNMVVHELSQPLASIGFYARAQKVLLNHKKQTPEDQKLTEAATGIFNLTEKASQIIQKVRNYASSKNEVFQAIDLKTVLNKTIQSLIATGSLKEQQIHLSLPNEPVYVSGSSLELELMFTNIIKNSLEAPNDQNISIDISMNLAPKHKVEVVVADNGLPLSKEEFTEILEPLNSLKPHGLGLGLSIVQAIVERHLGSLSINQLQDRGIAVHLVFPLRD